MAERLLHEVHLAWRALWRSKAFTLAAVATLGVGTAGATVILTLVQGVLLRPLPVHDQERLLLAWKELPAAGTTRYPFGGSDIKSIAEASQLLESVAAVTANGAARWTTIDDMAAAYVNGALVTGGFFHVLGTTPLLGRALAPADDDEGSEKVLVISAGLWERRYGRARDVLGRRITLDEQAFTIVGVMPPDIDYPRGAEVWRPAASVPTDPRFGDAARQEMDMIARMRPGVTLAQVTSELRSITRQLEAGAPPNAPRGFLPVARAFEDVVVGNARPVMVTLIVAVGIVLLIATANVANLLLMRGEARRGELAVCAALGAGRGRIVRQTLIESTLLAGLASVVGLLVTWWSLPALIAVLPEGLPRVEVIRVDGMVMLFVAVMAILTSLLAGLPPALLAARGDLLAPLHGSPRGSIGSSSARGRRALVVAQVALAVAVVAAAGLLTRTALRLQAVEVGIAGDYLVFADLSLPRAKYADRSRHAQFLADVTASVERIPGIQGVTPLNVLPFSGGWRVPSFAAEGQSDSRAAENPGLSLESVHANYFDALGVRIVQGRAFADTDNDDAPDVAIVSENVAAATWPGENPIGKRLKMGAPSSRSEWRTVVGIAAPTRYRELAVAEATLYVPAAQFLVAAQSLAIRATASHEQVAAALGGAIRSIDPTVSVVRLVPFSTLLEAPLARPRFNALLLAFFAIASLFLAAVGQYAVIAAYVRQREREIAVRMALGATAGNLRRLVLAEAVALAGAGTAIGLVAAIGATRWMRGLLFELDALDPVSLAGAALLLFGVSVAACYWPIRRATRVDVLTALRA